MDDVEDWENILVSFFKRVATLGHFERLRISLDWWGDFIELDRDALAPVAKALIRAIRGNQKLSCLDLSVTHSRFNWYPYLKDIFEAMEEHEGMRTFLVKDFEPKDVSDEVGTELMVPDFSWLEKLLSKNRKITVLDRDEEVVTNGSSIDAINALRLSE